MAFKKRVPDSISDKYHHLNTSVNAYIFIYKKNIIIQKNSIIK